MTVFSTGKYKSSPYPYQNNSNLDSTGHISPSTPTDHNTHRHCPTASNDNL